MSGAGLYATSRRGALSLSDIERARQSIGPRATPSMIVRYLGRCVGDVLALLTPTEKGA